MLTRLARGPRAAFANLSDHRVLFSMRIRGDRLFAGRVWSVLRASY